MTTKNTDHENSVLFNLRNLRDMQAERERREAEELTRLKELDEARRLEAALRAHADKEQERQIAEQLRAEAEQVERERRLTEREAEIRAQIEAETAEQLELLRAAYSEEPVARPRTRWSTIAAVASVIVTMVSLSIFTVVFTQNRHADAVQSNVGSSAMALADHATPPAAERPEAAKPDPEAVALNPPAPNKPKGGKPKVVKPRYKHVKRCRTKTVVVKRVRVKCTALSFDGCYRNVTKKVKTCRTVRVRVR